MNSFLEESRQVAIQPENNTAQQQLLDFLETLHPSITELVFKETLTGDLDFQILRECNFTNITSIKIPPGSVTSIRNLPDFITELVCSRNLLIELEDLPPSLVILEVRNNGIKRIDFRKLNSLKSLDIRQNLFVDIRNLPITLEKLYCSNNHIKTLDLDGLEDLKLLYCENNEMITISNFPDTITDLRMENNTETVEDDLSERQVEAVNISEALNKFFKLKSKYEKARLNKKRDTYKQLKEKGLGKRAIANHLLTLKHNCVNCGNKGNPEGTIFKIEERTYTALCGAEHPCKLNIRVFGGIFSDLYHYYTSFKDSVEDSKSATIQHKLDSLFDYTEERESVIRFKKIMKEYTEDNTILNEVRENYNEIHNNEERATKIDQKQFRIAEIKERIDDWLKEYHNTGNREILTMAIETHVNELLPEIRNLRFLLNEINEVIEIKDKKVLFQFKNQLQKLDYTFNEPPKVEKFLE